VIAPRRFITANGVEYALYQLGEAWVFEVEGARYFLTAGDDPMRQARVFAGRIPRNSLWEKTPPVLASERFPLILSIDTVIVRAWPKTVARDEPAKTFEHPYWRHRVAAVKPDAVWMFAARGRVASACGTVAGQQTLDDVTDLAKIWLRSIDQ
jgi:hypothetical protein